MKHLIVIEGPTASGKTTLSVALSKYFKTCVVSADSRQFYKELAIGTAKPSLEEQEGILHYFIDSHSVTNELTSGEYEKQALKVLENEFASKDVVILTGGSGMFIDALCIGLDDIPSSNELRTTIQNEFETEGMSPLLEELKLNDPDYYAEVDRQNPMRIIRAIEVIRLTGKPYSQQRISKVGTRPFKVHRFVINHDRKVLYERINQRVDLMMEAGLLDEVKSVIQYRTFPALNTVGYKEIFEFIDGKLTLEEAVGKIKINTRRYAKRQLTWFRRHPEAIWIDYTSTEEMKNAILSKLGFGMIIEKSRGNKRP